MKRKYQPVWERIVSLARSTASDKRVYLSVVPQLESRVRRGVIKEKNTDAGFKVMNDHDYFFLKICYDREKKVMTFELKQRLGLEGIAA